MVASQQYLPSIGLTSAELDLVMWAEDAMIDFWRDADRDGDGTDVVQHPMETMAHAPTRDYTVTIAKHAGVLADLKYRLLTQLWDMSESEDTAVARRDRATATRLWNKIDKVARANNIEVE